jgi:aminopeptidase YwaD
LFCIQYLWNFVYRKFELVCSCAKFKIHESLTCIFVLIILLLFGCQAREDAVEVRIENLMETVEFLASPELEGRLAGSQGLIKAAQFGADRFNEFGLAPAGDFGYFQPFHVEYNQVLAGSKMTITGKDRQNISLILGEDYSFRGFTGAGEVEAQVIFAGYGISRPDLGYDDYAGLDVEGKVVMIFKPNPAWRIDEQPWGDGGIRAKAGLAQSKGAAAVIFAPRPSDTFGRMPIGSLAHGGGAHLYHLPQMEVSKRVGDLLLEPLGHTLVTFQQKIDSLKVPASKPTGSVVSIKALTAYVAEQPTVNVVAMIEGVHPELKDEYVVIGAHIDHVGSQAGEVYYPGANDNASGASAVVELARVFSKLETKPERSILFVLFDAEELGLNGARYFVENSPVPLENIVAMLNFDCIAHGDSIQIGSGLSNPMLYEIAKAADADGSGMLTSNTWRGGGADATPFYEKGVPTLYFVSTNSYTHLHLPSDKPETLNPELFKAITKLGFEVALEVARGRYAREKVQ